MEESKTVVLSLKEWKEDLLKRDKQALVHMIIHLEGLVEQYKKDADRYLKLWMEASERNVQ